MKVYLVLDTDNRFIRRIYTKQKDLETFFRLYADDHCIVEEIDTKNHNRTRINEETKQRWGVEFDKENGSITDILRGVSIKEERIDNLLEEGTVHIFVDALTRSEAIDKAQKIYDNGKEETTI